MNCLILIIQILAFAFGLSLGLFLWFKPELAIKLQIGFYAKINWRVEPIFMSKEIRNTKIMGLFLVIATLLLTYLAPFLK